MTVLLLHFLLICSLALWSLSDSPTSFAHCHNNSFYNVNPPSITTKALPVLPHTLPAPQTPAGGRWGQSEGDVFPLAHHTPVPSSIFWIRRKCQDGGDEGQRTQHSEDMGRTGSPRTSGGRQEATALLALFRGFWRCPSWWWPWIATPGNRRRLSSRSLPPPGLWSSIQSLLSSSWLPSGWGSHISPLPAGTRVCPCPTGTYSAARSHGSITLPASK